MGMLCSKKTPVHEPDEIEYTRPSTSHGTSMSTFEGENAHDYFSSADATPVASPIIPETDVILSGRDMLLSCLPVLSSSIDASSSVAISPSNITIKSKAEDISVKVIEKSKVKLTTHKGDETPYITSSAVTSNGSIVFCDAKNNKLLYVSCSDENDDHSLKIETGSPYNIAVQWNKDTEDILYVTVPKEKRIRCYRVENKIKDFLPFSRSIKTNEECFGIEIINDFLFLSYIKQNTVCYKQTRKKSKTQQIDHGLNKPHSIKCIPSSLNGEFIVACHGKPPANGNVPMLSLSGDKVSDVPVNVNISPKLNIGFAPTCCAVDNEQNIFVLNKPAGCKGSIHVFGPNKDANQYFGEIVGLNGDVSMQHINILPDKTLLVTAESSDEITLYTVEINNKAKQSGN